MNEEKPAQLANSSLPANGSTTPVHDSNTTSPAAAVTQCDLQDIGLPLAFIANVVVVGGLGLGISAWLLHFTDLFETAASLFALTGVFSWIAAVSKLLQQRRVDALQSAADRFLNSWISFGLLALAGAGFLWWANGRGTIEIESRRDITDRSVTLSEVGRSSDQLSLEPGGHVRFNAATSHASPKEILVKVSGYPDRRERVVPWERTTLRVPSSFLRPVLLAKPDVDLIDQRDQGLGIVIKLNNRVVSGHGQFNGYAFWLGGDEGIEIPGGLQEVWREELTRRERTFSVRFWQSPIMLPGARFELKSQDQLCVEFQRPDDKSVYLRQDIVVKPLQRSQDFPQVEEIHDRDPKTPDPPHC